MKQKSLVKNFIYNFIYTGLNLLYPLITAPYISRILGATNLGKVNFATVIVNWFILFAVFGTATYGVREIAKVRDDKDKLEKVFSEIFIINAGMSLIVTIIYVLLVFKIEPFKEELPLFLIMSISIILNMFAIDWLFQGIEEYRYIAFRNAIVKSISLLCIFLFVNQSEHYIIYGLISVLANGISGVLNYSYSKKFIKLRFKGIKPLTHFNSLKIFFIHTFVVNIYTNLDQALLGFLIDTKSVAFMNRSKAIVSVATSISAAITNVTLPRASYYNKNDKKKFIQLLSEVPNYILWTTIPLSMGCITLASYIMFLLGGKEFLEATVLLQIVALTILFSPLSTYLQQQVLVASNKEKWGLYAAIFTSLQSIVLNVILIPLFGFIGAGIVQVISQISAVMIRIYLTKHKLGYFIRFINRSTISYFISALLMCGVIFLITNFFKNEILILALSLTIGGFVYIIILILLREKVTMNIVNKLITRIR